MLKLAWIYFIWLLVAFPVTAVNQSRTSGAGSTQKRGFISIDGASLKARFEAAVERARTVSQQKPFWTGYSFPIVRGIAVDPKLPSNLEQKIHGVNLRIGPDAYTPNVGILLLHDPPSQSITRFEVYNLDRQHDYNGFAVYWLGVANTAESLEYLAGLDRPGQNAHALENLPLAMAIHNGPQVEAALKDRLRNSRFEKVRAASAMWLGRVVPGQQSFLLDVARNERETNEVRSHAIWGLTYEKSLPVLPVLQELYQTVSSTELKEHIIASIAENIDQGNSADFLIQVAREDADRDLRKTATFWLGQFIVQQDFTGLSKSEEAKHGKTLRDKRAFDAMKQIPDEDAVPVLIQIAKTHSAAEMRKEAFQCLAEIGNKQVLEFFAQYLSK